ncbi:hypothetical protein AR9_g155 [Bacillus phage AR9]|uniref:Uncharacterized protein n=2 Tax=Bacillus phage PBS1 TaxID=10683 RepID=A0A172JI68_BPPB1|nr:hypothetical protein BI022_gp154 [Bacillus phage AR9]YP_009664245.1 hypothetical protein FK780_gp043 [Bacillus phage PBS1]WCS68278.1 hypothetical protein Goe21_01680 [Bacillus phage vB_BsuM-Goe21]AMS01239.1 hypothetical protein AR9_g155 [Bacillus phage AR9]AST99865.1 hypothetical protein PBI_PBS1_43 [Bacillus phage PBS1]BDE75315.1 hypothetical protein [Bacillus phage PBS1]
MLAFQDQKEFRNHINDFTKRQEEIDELMIDITEYIKEYLCTNYIIGEKLVLVPDERKIDIYFLEEVDSLLMCSIDIFSMVITGYKIDPRLLKKHKKMIEKQYKDMHDAKKGLTKRLSFLKSIKLPIKKRYEQIERIEYEIIQTDIVIGYINDYIYFTNTRDDLVNQISYDIQINFNEENDKYPFLKFSREYEFLGS